MYDISWIQSFSVEAFKIATTISNLLNFLLRKKNPNCYCIFYFSKHRSYRKIFLRCLGVPALNSRKKMSASLRMPEMTCGQMRVF